MKTNTVIENSVDPEVFVARGVCLQHQTALAKGPGATILDITPGLFGIAKQFSSGMHTEFENAAFCFLDAFGVDQGLHHQIHHRAFIVHLHSSCTHRIHSFIIIVFIVHLH